MASYWQIFISFFKIGSFTLGGGYAMIPLIQQEVVDKKGWLKENEFVEMMAIAQSAPGPIALNTAIFVGYKARGIKGVIFFQSRHHTPLFYRYPVNRYHFHGLQR